MIENNFNVFLNQNPESIFRETGYKIHFNNKSIQSIPDTLEDNIYPGVSPWFSIEDKPFIFTRGIEPCIGGLLVNSKGQIRLFHYRAYELGINEPVSNSGRPSFDYDTDYSIEESLIRTYYHNGYSKMHLDGTEIMLNNGTKKSQRYDELDDGGQTEIVDGFYFTGVGYNSVPENRDELQRVHRYVKNKGLSFLNISFITTNQNPSLGILVQGNEIIIGKH